MMTSLGFARADQTATINRIARIDRSIGSIAARSSSEPRNTREMLSALLGAFTLIKTTSANAPEDGMESHRNHHFSRLANYCSIVMNVKHRKTIELLYLG